MDPTVQVALVSVIATAITTGGVIAVASLNNRRERTKAAGAGVEAGLNEKDVLGRVLSLIAENERKEKTIASLTVENERLRFDNDVLKSRLGGQDGKTDG